MVAWLWIRLDSLWDALWFFLLRSGQNFPNSDFFFMFFFKEMLIPGPPTGCHEILNLPGFSIFCSNYINIWWWSWPFCIPQWPVQPSLSHHRLISHVILFSHCSLRKQNVLFNWRLWRKNENHLFILPNQCFCHFTDVSSVLMLKTGKKQSRFNCSNSHKPRANEPFTSFYQSAQMWILYTYTTPSIIYFDTGWLSNIKRNLSVQTPSKSIEVEQGKKTEWHKNVFCPCGTSQPSVAEASGFLECQKP